MGRPGVVQRRDVSVTDTIESNVGILGDIRYEVGSNGGAWYQCVKAGTTFSQGQPYQMNSLSTVVDTGVYSVGVNFTIVYRANGVYNAQSITIAANAYFWGQYAGKSVVLNDDGASIASNIPCHASDSGVVSGGPATDPIAFKTISSVTTGATAIMHIDCAML